MSRKYLPAWSHILSFDSFHFRGGGILKPSGGGPSAEPPSALCLRPVPVEKAADRAAAALRSEVVVGCERASASSARGVDMMWLVAQ